MGELSRIFELTERGETEGFSEGLVARAYDELRHIAANMMSHERPDHTLQATALVHEAYIRLLDSKRGGEVLEWPRAFLFRCSRSDAAHPDRERATQEGA